MSSHYRIGIFDSGLGGLTVMKKIREKLPLESIVYFGDTARLPYGSKSPETICKFSIENTQFLMDQNIKVLVIACSTASAHAAEKLREMFNIPILDVIQPGADQACKVTKSKRIAVLGTKATIQSKAYEKAIKERLPDAFVISVACPLLVHLVEERFLHHSATRLILQEYLKTVKNADVDTLLLGCTHYPSMAKMIKEEMGIAVEVVDSGSEAADRLQAFLQEQDLESNLPGECEFFVSDDPVKFMDLAPDFFGETILKCEIFHHDISLV